MSWQDVQFYSSIVITLKATSDLDDRLSLLWGIGVGDSEPANNNALYTEVRHVSLSSGAFITYEFSVKTRWLKITLPSSAIPAIRYNLAPTAIKFMDNGGNTASVHHGDVSSALFTILTDSCNNRIATSADTSGSAVYVTLCDISGIPLYTTAEHKLGVALVDNGANAIGTSGGVMNVVYSDACGHPQAFNYNSDASAAAGNVVGFYALCDNCGKPIDTVVSSTNTEKNALYVTLCDSSGRLITVNNPLQVYSLMAPTAYAIDTSVGDAMTSLVNINDKVSGKCFNINSLHIYNSYDTTIWIKLYDIYDTLGAVGQIFGVDRFDLIDQNLKLNMAVPAGTTRDIYLENGLLFYHGCMARASTQFDYTAGTNGNLGANAVYVYGSYNQVSSIDGRDYRPSPYSYIGVGDTIVEGRLFGFSGWFCNAMDTSIIAGAITGFNTLSGTQDICVNILTVWDDSVGTGSYTDQYVAVPKIPTTLYVASSGGSIHLDFQPYKIHKSIVSILNNNNLEVLLCFGFVSHYNNADNQNIARFIMDSSYYSIDLWNQTGNIYAGMFLQNNQYTNTLISQVDQYLDINTASGPITVAPDATSDPNGLQLIKIKDPITTKDNQRVVFINPNCTIADMCLSVMLPYVDNCLSLEDQDYNIDNSLYFTICGVAVSSSDSYGRITLQNNCKMFCYSTPDFRGSTMYINDTSIYRSFTHLYRDVSLVTAYVRANGVDAYYDNFEEGYIDSSFDISYVRIHIDGSAYDSSSIDVGGYPQPQFLSMIPYVPDSTFNSSTNIPKTEFLVATSDGSTVFGTPSDGTVLHAITGTSTYTSVNISNILNAASIKCSYDGQYIAIASNNADNSGIFVSDNSGTTFSQILDPPIPVDNIAMSSDGKYMIAAPKATTVPIYSTNYGSTFVNCGTNETNATENWLVSVSEDGYFMVAISSTTATLIWSVDVGGSWNISTPLSSAIQFTHMFCSSDGSKLLLYEPVSKFLYTIQTDTLQTNVSYDYGSTAGSTPVSCSVLAVSANLNTVCAADTDNIYINYNYGREGWITHDIGAIKYLTMSSDGRKIFATNGTSNTGFYVLGQFPN